MSASIFLLGAGFSGSGDTSTKDKEPIDTLRTVANAGGGGGGRLSFGGLRARPLCGGRLRGRSRRRRLRLRQRRVRVVDPRAVDLAGMELVGAAGLEILRRRRRVERALARS